MNSKPNQEGPKVDFKRVLYRSLKFWYLIVLSLFIALAIAYLRNRYIIRIYPVSASILIKETQEAGGKLLYNNPLVSSYRNYLNEIYIIRSHPLIENTLEALHFDVSFYQQGNFLTTDAYKYMPLKAYILNSPDFEAATFSFKIISNEAFTIASSNNEEGSLVSKTFNFNDTVSYEGLDLVVNVSEQKLLDKYLDVPFIMMYTSPKVLAPNYIARLKAIWAEPGAGVITLSMNGPNPEKDIDFLHGLIEQYQQYDLEKKNQSASRTVAFISDQLKNISDSLQGVENKLERFKDKNVATDLGEEATRLYVKLEKLENEKAEMTIQHNYYTYLVKYLSAANNLDQVILPTSVGINDGVLSGLVGQLINIQMEISLVRAEKRTNPIIAGKIQEIEKLKEDIIESVRNQINADKLKSDFLNKQITSLEVQVNRLPLLERQLVSIKRSYNVLESLYIFLLQKRAEASISKASTTTDIVMVNPPLQAGGAIVPKVGQNYLIAALLGLILPLAFFFLAEFLNTKIQSKEDVEKITQIPIIVGVGHNVTLNNMVVLSEPKSIIAESFRALRSNINYFIGNKEKSLFLITSSLSNEGKTFTTINMASVFALAGKKTLIVGADLRKPKLYADFGLSNTIGLSNYLAGLSEFDEVIQKTDHENIDLISGGPVPPNPAELLMTERLDKFIQEAKARYDYVFIDTPPVIIVTDAFSLTKYADHTIFVVRQNYTPKNVLQTADELYKSGRLTKVSIILNDIHASGLGYGYGYGYYGKSYGYGGYVQESKNKSKNIFAKFFKS